MLLSITSLLHWSNLTKGEKLYGRGTTDCLGHVAVITTLFSQLAELKPELNVNVNAVFIASEEASGPGVGVDALMASGKMGMCHLYDFLPFGHHFLVMTESFRLICDYSIFSLCPACSRSSQEWSDHLDRLRRFTAVCWHSERDHVAH